MVTKIEKENYLEWFKKHWIITILLTLIALGIVSSIFNNDSGDEATQTSGDEATQTSGENQIIIYDIGESFMVDDISYIINSVQTTESLSGLIFTKEAGGIFYIISITAENKGTKPKEYFTPYFRIIDSQEREFSDDRKAPSYATKYGKELLFEQLQPGLSKSGIIIFDLPKDATGLKLRVKNSVWGLYDAYVNLGV